MALFSREQNRTEKCRCWTWIVFAPLEAFLRLSFHNIRMVLLALNFLGFTSAPSLTSDSVKFYHHCVGRFSFLRSSFINSIAHQRYSTLFNTSRVEVAFMIPIRGWFLPRNIFSSCYNRTQNSVGSSVGPIQKLGKLLPKVDLTAITRRFRTKTQIYIAIVGGIRNYCSSKYLILNI